MGQKYIVTRTKVNIPGLCSQEVEVQFEVNTQLTVALNKLGFL